jgi:hypothetical protein
MLSKLPVAAVQMDANPAPCGIRLQAAASLVAQAETAWAAAHTKNEMMPGFGD